jgi:hypothetical protein
MQDLQISRLTNLQTEKIGPILWRVTHPLMYWVESGPVTVPVNFITDGASCPQILWELCSPMSGPQVEGAVLHDYLYSKDSGFGMNRKQADQMFRDAMLANGTKHWRAMMIYRGVRLGGMKSWKACWSKDKIK